MLRDIETSLTLIDGLAAEASAAWDRFVRLYFRPLTEFAELQARRWNLGPADAADAVQRLFIGMARRTRIYDPARGSFRNWLMMQVKSEVKDLARAARSRGIRERLGAERLEDIRAEAVTDDEAEEVRKALFATALKLALGQCEVHTAEAFRRYALRGEPAARVASDLGITVNNLYQIRSRILDRVADALEELPEL